MVDLSNYIKLSLEIEYEQISLSSNNEYLITEIILTVHPIAIMIYEAI